MGVLATSLRRPTILRLGRFLRPSTMPESVAREVASWPVITRSTYSDSYYSAEGKAWGITPEGCMRASDHWNFMSGGSLHCRTTTPVADRTHWSVARYVQGKWEVVLSVPLVTAAETRAVLDAQARLRIEETALWRPSDRAILRRLVSRPVLSTEMHDIVASAASRSAAVDRLADIGLLVASARTESGWGRKLPNDVARHVGRHYRGRAVYWLNPNLVRTARALVMAWETGHAGLRPALEAGEKRRWRRLMDAVDAMYPSLPDTMRDRLEGQQFVSIDPRDGFLIQAAVRRAAIDQVMADIAGSPQAALAMAGNGRPLSRSERSECLRRLAAATVDDQWMARWKQVDNAAECAESPSEAAAAYSCC